MSYFVEFYNLDLHHVGTRSLRATDAEAAKAEAVSLRHSNGYTVILYEVPPRENYRVLATFS